MKKRLILTSLLSLFSFISFSQILSGTDVNIHYSNPDEIKACDGSDTLHLIIENISGSAFDPGSTITIDFPEGVDVVNEISTTYSFLSFNATTNAYTYENSFGHSSSASFTLDLVLNINCAIYDLLDNTGGSLLDIKNIISFDYDIGGSPNSYTDSTITYNVAQANVKTTVPLFNQTITVPNDYSPFNQCVRYDVVGNSFLDEFILKFIEPAGLTFNGIDSVIVNGTPVSGYGTLTPTTGGEYLGALIATDLGLTEFNTGDVIIVYYNFTPECLTSVNIDYSTCVECHGDTCSFDNDLGFVNLIQDPPSYTITFANDQNADLCGNSSTITFTIVNEDTSGYTIYNPYFWTNLYSGTWSNLQVNGETVISGFPTATTGNVFWYMNNMQSSSGYVLDDYNGDGVYGEISPGDTLVFTFEFYLDSNMAGPCPGYQSNYLFYSQFRYYETVCTSSPLQIENTGSIYYQNYNSTPPSLSLVSGSLADGSSQTWEFCLDRYINEVAYTGASQMLLDDEVLMGLEVLLPCGMTMDNPTTAVWTPDGGSAMPITVTTTTNPDGTSTVDFLAGSGQIPLIGGDITGCLTLETDFNCDTCSNIFETVYFNAHNEFLNCDTEHPWACESVFWCTDCTDSTSCDSIGRIDHTGFTVDRTNFGWTNSTMTTLVTQLDVDAAPGDYNTTGAYACDTIRMHLTANVCGGVDDFTPYFFFEKPTGLTLDLLSIYSAEITIGGTPSPIGYVASDLGLEFEFAFDTQTGPFPDGTTLELEVMLVVVKNAINDPSMPNHLMSTMTGAFYTNTAWVSGASPVSPTNETVYDLKANPCLYPNLEFDFYKVLPYLFTPGSTVQCGLASNKQIFRIGYTGGSSGDDFPNEFRPFNILKDSLVFELSNPLHVGSVFVTSATMSPSTPLTVTQTGSTIVVEPTSGVWPVIDKNNFQNYYLLWLTIEFNCDIVNPIELEKDHITYCNYLYSNDPACIDEDTLTGTSFHPVQYPNLDFVYLNPIQDAVSPTADFDFNVNNNSSFPANYPWMLITYNPALVNVTVTGATSYAWSTNQIYVELGSIAGYSTLSDVINISPIFCDVEQVTEVYVESGYHCLGYPTVPGTFDPNTYCPLQTDTLELTILKSNLNVDLLTSFSPSEPVNQCNGKFSILLQMYNDQKADISDLKVQFDSIPGLTLIGSSYHHPLPLGGSFDPLTFNWTMVNPLDFTSIPPADSDSLQQGFYFDGGSWGLDTSGTLNGILANDGVNLYNFYHMKLDFIVDCDFDVNEELIFEICGISNCGDPIVLTTSTFVDFLPPFTDLNLSMSFADDACDSLATNDIFVTMYNNDTVAHDSLYIDLFCDTDGDGLFDPNIDTYLSSELLLDGFSSLIVPGDSATVGFNSDLLGPCPNGQFIAQLTNSDTCYCNYNYIIDTLICCECSDSSGTSPITSTMVQADFFTTYWNIHYQVTGYPLTIKNLTGNPNDPSLYVYDQGAATWVYPVDFYPPCNHMMFDAGGTVLRVRYGTNFVPLPHVIQTKLIYPSINNLGDTCDVELPDCDSSGVKFDCPLCWVYGIDSLDCAGDAADTFTGAQLNVSVNEAPKLELYPNPVADELVIISDYEILSIEISDTRGRKVLVKESINKSTVNLNVSDLPPATYFIEVHTESGILLFEKFIKQ